MAVCGTLVPGTRTREVLMFSQRAARNPSSRRRRKMMPSFFQNGMLGRAENNQRLLSFTRPSAPRNTCHQSGEKLRLFVGRREKIFLCVKGSWSIGKHSTCGESVCQSCPCEGSGLARIPSPN